MFEIVKFQFDGSQLQKTAESQPRAYSLDVGLTIEFDELGKSKIGSLVNDPTRIFRAIALLTEDGPVSENPLHIIDRALAKVPDGDEAQRTAYYAAKEGLAMLRSYLEPQPQQEA